MSAHCVVVVQVQSNENKNPETTEIPFLDSGGDRYCEGDIGRYYSVRLLFRPAICFRPNSSLNAVDPNFYFVTTH